MTFQTQDVYKRFSTKHIETENGCWEWQSTLNQFGYGKFWYGGGQTPAHRVSYILHVGEIPPGMNILHKCDNRKCVNPEHLYPGTGKQNAKDRTERSSWWGGSVVPFEHIEEIRRLYKAGGISQQKLADMYGMHQTQVSRYVTGKQRIAF